MKRRFDPLSPRQHRKIGADLFNYTWSLLDKKRRTREEDDEMIRAAHASRYHWDQGGRDLNRSIGDWQISRVYAVLGQADLSRHHAELALQFARRGRVAPFYIAYAYEALARAAAVSRRPKERDRYLARARTIGRKIRSRDDRRMLEEDLASVR